MKKLLMFFLLLMTLPVYAGHSLDKTDPDKKCPRCCVPWDPHPCCVKCTK